MDSSGGAGSNQDIRVCALFDEQILCCVSGITIQSDIGVEAIHPVSRQIFEAQLISALNNPALSYVKIGAICAKSQIPILIRCLGARKKLVIVLDPILQPTQGTAFIPQSWIPQYLELLRISHFVCPNLHELQTLSRMKVHDFASALIAAKDLAQKHDTGILLKGGHGITADIEEAFVGSSGVYHYHHPRFQWSYTHGSGCALSSAFTCFLAVGNAPHLAFERASAWVAKFYNAMNQDRN